MWYPHTSALQNEQSKHKKYQGESPDTERGYVAMWLCGYAYAPW